jgi:hypothetical protein
MFAVRMGCRLFVARNGYQLVVVHRKDFLLVVVRMGCQPAGRSGCSGRSQTDCSCPRIAEACAISICL